MYDECFRLASFLDPNYGPGFFDKDKQSEINEILRNSIAGHIYQSKRRRMTPNFYSEYVFCKLNEKLL